MLRCRLRLPVTKPDTFCPFCDGIQDKFVEHALSCACGRDRVKRHNRLRGLVASRAQRAGLAPEMKKPGLPTPRLDAQSAPNNGMRTPAGRWPWTRNAPLQTTRRTKAPIFRRSLCGSEGLQFVALVVEGSGG